MTQPSEDQLAGSSAGTEELSLAADFPAVTREDWRALVAGVLRKSGVDTEGLDRPEDRFARTTYDGITVAPLYTAEDSAPPAGVPGLAPYVRGGRLVSWVNNGWDVRQRHAHPDAKASNDAILADLENGVTSLWLTLGEHGAPIDQLDELLSGVYLDLAGVVLDAGAETARAADKLLAVAEARGLEPARLNGGLGFDPLGYEARTGTTGDTAEAVAYAKRLHSGGATGLRTFTVDAQPYHDAGGSDAEELGCSLAVAVTYLRALTDGGMSVDEAFEQIEFRYAATADQFLTIAKFRAARRLWSRVGELSGAREEVRAQRQHAVTSSAMMTARDPWVNMLRTTLATFGAGVGGADAVTVQPFDACLGLPDDFSRRVARNTQALLLEESHLARVIDPAGGSYYVEKLTDDLAAAAWAWFTEIERAGGFTTALRQGLVADRLAATWAERAKKIAHRKDAITGVSEFPNLGEKLPVRPAAPPVPSGGLPRLRYAQLFEELRDAADAHAESTGTRPTVFLATIGAVAAFTARSTFAGNLFQAGGIRTPDAGPGTDPAAIARSFADSGAEVACLCGHDKAYAELAGPVARALKEAGARTVLLAGKPGERAASDAEAGIDGYVFAGCDALDVLRTTLSQAGAL
ncbi:methylmalonyl-CoA mutase small subunit [Allokutzneria oryzae]|uniref:Methylmalonyl-CoA mutase small subunit n=1 Tax=Allokutzneria oryzae TaxID=1378989 RepID=A0ABV6A1Q3_9PSEU